MSQSRTSKVFALSLGQGLTTVVALVSGMFMARVLTQADLASYRQTILSYDIAAPFLALGLGSALYYFLPEEKKRARGILVDGIIILVAMGLLYSFFIALGGNNILSKRFSNSAVAHLLLYYVPYPLIMLPAGLLGAVLIVREHVTLLSAYNVISHLCLVIAIIGACLIWKTPQSMIIVRVIICLASGLTALYLMFKFIQKDSWFPSRDNMLSMVKYSLPLTFASMMGTLSLQLDQLIVSSLCTPEEFAVYSFGAMEIPLVGILTGSIATVILPDIRRFVVAGKNSDALALFRQAAEKSAWILFPTMLFLMVSADSFMRTFFSAKYAASVTPFRIHLLILPARIVYFGTLLMALGQTKAIFFRELIGLVINILLGILIVKNIGYNGAAFAKVISMYAWNLSANLFLVSRSMSVTWSQILPFQRLGKIIIYFAIPTLFIFLTNQIHFKMSWLQLTVNAAIFCCSGLFVCGKPFIAGVLPNYRNTMSYHYLENIYKKIATGSFV